MPRPIRRATLAPRDALGGLDRMTLAIIGVPASRRRDLAEVNRLAEAYRAHRAEVWAFADARVPEAFWFFEQDIPADLVRRHDAGEELSRLEVLDALPGIRK